MFQHTKESSGDSAGADPAGVLPPAMESQEDSSALKVPIVDGLCIESFAATDGRTEIVELDEDLSLPDELCEFTAPAKTSIYLGVEVRRILIINFESSPGLGDQMVPMALPDLLQKKFPQAKIDLIVQHPALYESTNYSVAGPKVFGDREMRGQHHQRSLNLAALNTKLTNPDGTPTYDLVIDLDYPTSTRYADVEIPILVARRMDDFDFQIRRSGERWRHLGTTIAENMYHRFRHLSELLELDQSEAHLPQLAVSEENKSKALGVLQTLGVETGKALLIINPATFAAVKELSHKDWNAILSAFVLELKRRDETLSDVQLCVSQGTCLRHWWTARNIASRLKKLLHDSGATVALLPRIPFSTFLGTLCHADGVITMDTGVAHCAPALQIPTLTLFTHMQPETWKHPQAHAQFVPFGLRSDKNYTAGVLEQLHALLKDAREHSRDKTN